MCLTDLPGGRPHVGRSGRACQARVHLLVTDKASQGHGCVPCMASTVKIGAPQALASPRTFTPPTYQQEQSTTCILHPQPTHRTCFTSPLMRSTNSAVKSAANRWGLAAVSGYQAKEASTCVCRDVRNEGKGPGKGSMGQQGLKKRLVYRSARNQRDDRSAMWRGPVRAA